MLNVGVGVGSYEAADRDVTAMESSAVMREQWSASSAPWMAATAERLPLEALREMERLGLLCDISHLGASGVAHVLELATRPLIATNSNARALRDHHRNLTDDQRKVSADQIVDHIEHVITVAGIDPVGLGSDFVREVMTDVTPPCCESLDDEDPMFDFPGLEGPAGMPRVTEAPVQRGLAEDDILKILGRNTQRLMNRHMG